MRSTFLGRTALASALLFAIGACGDSGSGGPDFDDEATTEETADAAASAIQFIGDAVEQLNFDGPDIALSATKGLAQARALRGPIPLPSSLPAEIAMPGLHFTASGGIQLSAAPGCSVSSWGTDGDPWDWYDGNENGVADDWGIDYRCVTKDSADVENIRTYTQVLKLQIKENTASVFGYHATQSYSSSNRWEDGNGYGGGFEMEETLDLRAGSATHAVHYDGKEWGEGDSFGDGEGGRAEFAYGASSNVSFDPDGTIIYGDPLPDGDLDVSGRIYFAETDDVSLSFSFETTDPLAFESSCYGDTHPPYVDGTLVGRLNGNAHSASYEVNFTDCGSYEVETHNTSDEPVVVTQRPPQGERAAMGRR